MEFDFTDEQLEVLKKLGFVRIGPSEFRAYSIGDQVFDFGECKGTKEIAEVIWLKAFAAGEKQKENSIKRALGI
jgi:hypothetical protein